ncbi:hypothetical protein [Nannocystis pusilla]|uniref:hypothetical protein n=1 Tax=Nannocystis pusilla TaxID=889268 RepID=UPI003B7615C1
MEAAQQRVLVEGAGDVGLAGPPLAVVPADEQAQAGGEVLGAPLEDRGHQLVARGDGQAGGEEHEDQSDGDVQDDGIKHGGLLQARLNRQAARKDDATEARVRGRGRAGRERCAYWDGRADPRGLTKSLQGRRENSGRSASGFARGSARERRSRFAATRASRRVARP